jgi:hypothetical protein
VVVDGAEDAVGGHRGWVGFTCRGPCGLVSQFLSCRSVSAAVEKAVGGTGGIGMDIAAIMVGAIEGEEVSGSVSRGLVCRRSGDGVGTGSKKGRSRGLGLVLGTPTTVGMTRSRGCRGDWRVRSEIE